jgi:hypothetical protein
LEDIGSNILSEMQHLMRLELAAGARLEPVSVAPLTHLQRLELAYNTLFGGTAGTAQLERLQQLTHLNLAGASSMGIYREGIPPAAAYSVLTASSKLEHLDICHGRLPAAVAAYVPCWQAAAAPADFERFACHSARRHPCGSL